MCRPTLISLSYISECIHNYQFRLNLSSCSYHQPKLELDLICVGTWIEGSHTYFVTRSLSKETYYNQYSCFVCQSSILNYFYLNINFFFEIFLLYTLSHIMKSYVTKDKDIASSFSLRMATDGSCRHLNFLHMTTEMTLLSSSK